ncbi:ATP-dependent Clp protease ATP-binding subunit [Patescibacteria group bacterium]|nr:ATP-dependent Clp protease ATP-binding subunit [Patescibacteria group bacterium]MBU4056566.1 ATP-dependent Clp protease ATP-binding subunit [Patescibacteria group bacterium]MBU4368415.1 ATP-dependent Clp protease ATP-binding subunit [Patescibacteria group bacterium]
MGESSQTEKIEKEIMFCPFCGGNGCVKCENRGVWLKVGGAKYFWQPKTGAASIISSVVKSVLFALFKFFAVIFVIFSFWEAFDFSLVKANGFYPLFAQKGPVQFLFWSSLGILIYWIYNKKIKPSVLLEGDLALMPKVNLNIEPFFSPSAKSKIYAAITLARKEKNPGFVWRLLKVLINEKKMIPVFEKLEQSPEKISRLINQRAASAPEDRGAESENGASAIPDAKKTALLAFADMSALGKNKIDETCLLFALLRFDEINFFFEKEAEVETSSLRYAAFWTQTKPSRGIFEGLFKKRGKRLVKIKHRIMNRAWTARPTPTLDRFSRDITDFAAARVIAPIVNRRQEIDQVMRILERNSKNNALLVGEVGSGRKSIVNEIGRLIVREKALPNLHDKRLVALDASQVISGVKAGGELESRVHLILSEIHKAGNVILFIPDIHNLAESGSEYGFDISEILAPVFSMSAFQVIGSTTFYDYHRTIEKRGDFADTFDIIKVEEVSPEITLEILMREAPVLEDKEGVFFTFGAFKKAVELSKRYIFNKLLPSKAVDLLSEAAVIVRTRRGKNAVVSSEDIANLITEKTGVPITKITAGEAARLVNLESEIHRRVIGQNEAVRTVAEAIKRMRVGLRNEKKPVGVFLFLGPTGVGKTELAKSLAEVYFGSEESMIRLDMSEFQSAENIDRLIGSTDGNTAGRLTEGVKKQPFSLILLDEFEKTHPSILDLFLQVFDDGRLTDSFGRTRDFTNTIIIATSNVGSKIIQERLKEGKKLEDFRPEIEANLLNYFKPELLNRFNAQILFTTLSPEEILQIARLQIKKLSDRLENAQGIKLEVLPEAMNKITELGYSPLYGARNLQRVITEKIENIIADKFLRGEIKRGQTFTIKNIE